MHNFIPILIALFLFRPTRPGESLATLTCKSETGRTTFYAELPSCSYLDKAELAIDGVKLNFISTDRSYIICDPDNRVFTVTLESNTNDPKKDRFVKFWALPSTFKKIKSEKGPGSQFHTVYEFKGKLFGTEPRKTDQLNTKTIELTCTLDIEL